MARKLKINWDDKKCKISKYFTVHEATYLNSWGVHHIPSEEEKANILLMAEAGDIVREFIGKPIIVHCWIRPLLTNPDKQIIVKSEDLLNPVKLKAYNTLDYNLYIGSKNPSGAHPRGLGLDFHVLGYEGVEGCHQIREILLPKLEEFGIRMEDVAGSWIHIDLLPVKYHRFFKP